MDLKTRVHSPDSRKSNRIDDKESRPKNEKHKMKRSHSDYHRHSKDGSSSSSDQKYEKYKESDTRRKLNKHRGNYRNVPYKTWNESSYKERNEDRHDTHDKKNKNKINEAHASHKISIKSKHANSEYACTRNTSCEDENDFDFNWEKCKLSLDKIFFTETDSIKKETQEYKEFWLFLKKFLVFHRKKSKLAMATTDSSFKSRLDIPLRYDRRYRINLSLSKTADDIKRLASTTSHASELSAVRLSQFKYILLSYMDFCQKQKFNKLKQIKKSQENLPIFKYKDVIVKTVQDCPVVVIAGDTGCGKSTQVQNFTKRCMLKLAIRYSLC